MHVELSCFFKCPKSDAYILVQNSEVEVWSKVRNQKYKVSNCQKYSQKCKVRSLGPVVQSWVSANPGLKFKGLVYPSVSFKTLGIKTSTDIEKISEEIFPGL